MTISITRAGRVVAACAVALLAVTGCGRSPAPESTPSDTGSATPTGKSKVPDRQPHTLVLKATGSANVTSVKYTVDREVKKKGKADLPWRKSVTVPADGKPHSWSLDVKFTGTGRVMLVAIFNGAVVAQGGSAGSGSGTKGSASVGGTVRG